MNFASPPDFISPASYPSSPESLRTTPNLSRVATAAFGPISDYSQAISSDPFQQEAANDAADQVIVEAQTNAQTNNELVYQPATPSKPSKADAVKDTLSRFAAGPRRLVAGGERGKENADTTSQKSAMDVDAFKRLLLTGESGASAAANISGPITSHNVSDSSSTADTASTSQRSLFEVAPPPVEETPRSSYEQERPELVSRQQVSSDTMPGSGARRKPPPPRPRHGRTVSESTTSSRNDLSGTSTSDAIEFNLQAGTSTQENSQSEEPRKRPPPPPLARRKSSKNQADRPSMTTRIPSQQSFTSESDEAISPQPKPAPTKMAPPPPPLRRANTSGSRKTSSDLPSTVEEDESGLATPEARPVGSRTSSSTKRMTQTPVGTPPPLPPPRRNRASSRSSVDSQRPSLSGLMTSEPSRNSQEFRRPSNASDSRNVSGGSNFGADILADLAALQREVDAARGRVE